MELSKQDHQTRKYKLHEQIYVLKLNNTFKRKKLLV